MPLSHSLCPGLPHGSKHDIGVTIAWGWVIEILTKHV